MVKKGNKKQYAWNDEERLELMEQMGQGSSVQRYKGLGEMNAEQLWETTLNPEHRTLRQITLDNLQEADRSEERRVGKECRCRWAAEAENEKEGDEGCGARRCV